MPYERRMLDPEIYRNVLEILPTGVYLVDRERRILFWNEGAERITGYRRQEVIGRYCQDDLLMHCDSQRNILCGSGCPLQATMHDGQPRQADVLLRHRSGERVPVRIRSVPLRDERGTIIGAVECFEEPFGGVESEEEHPDTSGGPRDELTGLLLRPGMETRLNESLAEYQQLRNPFALLAISIDRMEQFRHSYGALAGNALLRSLAHTLSRNLHPGESLSRWNGIDFVALLSSKSLTELQATAERLQRVVAMATISWWGDRLSATVSIGAALVQTEDTAASLMSRAEEFLRRCQSDGGDRTVCG